MNKMQTDNPLLNSANHPKKPKGRWILFLLFIFFAAPLVLVTLMHKLDWHPTGGSRGHMVSPVKPVDLPAGLADSEGQAVSDDLFKDKWSMVYIAEQCDGACSTRLHDMRQIHASLAKHIPRVQRILVTTQQEVGDIKGKYPDMVVLNQPAAQQAELMQQFDLPDAVAGSSQRVYFVDPLGNLMMSYPLTIVTSDIRKDLNRLLAYAWAG
jgi:cytochrome oxidase Cu insertion factor (SCO1/SenC/PrrC family)